MVKIGKRDNLPSEKPSLPILIVVYVEICGIVGDNDSKRRW